MPGRKPRPTKLKLLAGERNKSRINDREPTAPSEPPEAPSGLSADGTKEWSRITSELDALGILSSVDRAALWAYLEAYERRCAARRKWRREGMVKRVVDRLNRHPAIAIEEKAADQCRALLCEFGLTPASRSRIVAMPKSGKKTGLAKYLG